MFDWTYLLLQNGFEDSLDWTNSLLHWKASRNRSWSGGLMVGEEEEEERERRGSGEESEEEDEQIGGRCATS